MKKMGLSIILGVAFIFIHAQEAKLMLPVGHTSGVTSAQFSPDGKFIVTASGDKTAKIWEAKSGKLLHDLIGHSDAVKSAQFSPDGKFIVTASGDKTAKIWEAKTGKLEHDLIGHTNNVNTAQFSSDGKFVVTASSDNTAKIWETNSGKLVYDLIGHSDYVSSAQFSPDGKFIVTASGDKTAKIWVVNSGKLVYDLIGHSDYVNSAQFSPDGKFIVTASGDKTAKIWVVNSGKLIHELIGYSHVVNSAQFSPDGKFIATTSLDSSAKVWDPKTGKLVQDLIGHTGWVKSAQFSPDGKFIITASDDKTAKIWEANSGKLVYDLIGHTDYISSAQFSSDGKFIATTSWDFSAKVWDAKTGKLAHNLNFKGHTDMVNSAQFSPDGKFIAITSWDFSAKVWDPKTGKVIHKLIGHTRYVSSAQFSPDGKLIVTASGDKIAKIWEVNSGKLVHDLIGHSADVYSAQFSHDGKFISTTSWDFSAKVWDATTGKLVHDLIGHTRFVSSAQFSPDGKFIVTASADKTAKIWEVNSGKLIHDLAGHTGWVKSAQFSPDGKFIVTSSYDKTAKVWEVKTGKLIHNLIRHSHAVNSAQFSPDGKFIVSASDDSTAKVWDVTSGKLIHNLIGHTSRVNSALFSPDGKYILTNSVDNTTRKWDLSTGKLLQTISLGLNTLTKDIDFTNDKIVATNNSEIKIFKLSTGEYLYSFFAIDSKDYLVVDKYYRYDGTEAARKLLYFTCNTEIIDLDQVKDQLWVPNLAERIIKGETINTPKLSDLNICNYTPMVESNEQSDKYIYTITPQRGGVGETVLYVNNIEVERFAASSLTKTKTGYELQLNKTFVEKYFIGNQVNTVTVKTFTAKNDIASRGVSLKNKNENKNTTPANLFAVMVGVSDYKGDELDLKYAAKDAEDLSNAVANAAQKLLGKEHVFMYNLKTGTNRNYFPEKQSIKNVLTEIGKKANPNDILFIFFAGHGVMEGEKKQFYFLTADASQNGDITTTGISIAELNDWMKPNNIKAQKRVLIFDACNSGQAINDLVTIGNKNDNYYAARSDEESNRIKAVEKLNEKSGMFVFSASASNQSAYELGKYAQGVLTYCLLKSIKEQPDILEDGKYLNVDKWFATSEKMVSDIVSQTGNRQQPQKFGTGGFNVGLVDNEVVAAIILPQEKPLFTNSNFQNNDDAVAYDDLELSKLVNNELNSIATRGTDSKISFINTSNSPDAYTLSGRYDIHQEEVSVKVNIIHNKKVAYRFEIKGKKNELNKLSGNLVKQVEDWLQAKK